MLCDFATAPLPNGHYRHVCRRPGCGRDVQTAAASCALRCRAEGHPEGTRQGATRKVPGMVPAPRAPPAELDRRAAICRDCAERPPGCWKTREYGCQRAYREAGQRAAENADCPIGRLKRINQ